MAKKQSKLEAAGESSFEEALEQLGETVRQLEEGEIGLNEALEQYEKGVKLLRRCYDLLQGAERRIALLSGVDAEGNPVATPMDAPAPSLDDKASGRGRSKSGPPSPSEEGFRGPGDTDMDAFGGLT